ncbi:hypothetical protein C8R44DRAFT_749231 [Mycena epipterygia]|nr:hypothetical protein C8R44DRAFT_749231 [Mycena epipterygia]
MGSQRTKKVVVTAWAIARQLPPRQLTCNCPGFCLLCEILLPRQERLIRNSFIAHAFLRFSAASPGIPAFYSFARIYTTAEISARARDLIAGAMTNYTITMVLYSYNSQFNTGNYVNLFSPEAVAMPTYNLAFNLTELWPFEPRSHSQLGFQGAKLCSNYPLTFT